MNPKENFLQAIYFEKPDYVPTAKEDIMFSFSFDDIVRMENWTDRWQIEWKLELAGTVPFPKGNPLSDLSKLDDYEFPDPSDLKLSEQVAAALLNVDKAQKLIIGNMTYLLFERAWALMGMENFLMALIDYPQDCHDLLHKIALYARGVFERYLEMGVDGISFSEDLGSQKALMMSPALFREFFLPEYSFIFEPVLSEKKIINFHSCGCVDAIASDLASIGVTMLNPVQSRANDLFRLKTETAGKTALQGGIDTDLLLRGTPAMVRAETIRVFDILKPGGGYICGPDQHFPSFPEENMNMLWKTAAEFGVY